MEKRRFKKARRRDCRLARSLTAAYYCSDGHDVQYLNLTETAACTCGIPEYRLRTSWSRDQYIEEWEFNRTGVKVGKDVTVDDLKADGYKAILMTVGANVSQKMGVPGEDLHGVVGAVEFLADVNLGKNPEVGKKVAVIGGGNAAIDAARTALRLGAEEVHIIYRRQREDMPADKREIEEAEHEGIKIHFLTVPTKMIGTRRETHQHGVCQDVPRRVRPHRAETSC